MWSSFKEHNHTKLENPFTHTGQWEQYMIITSSDLGGMSVKASWAAFTTGIPMETNRRRKLLILWLLLVDWQIIQNRGWTTVMKKLNNQYRRRSVKVSCYIYIHCLSLNLKNMLCFTKWFTVFFTSMFACSQGTFSLKALHQFEDE